MRTLISSRKVFALALAVGLGVPAGAQSYKVTNLVSDGSVAASVMDPNFLNPWGISASGAWWISTANSGYNYVVGPTGAISFKVIVPSAANVSTQIGLPSGSVTTGGSVGMVLPNGTKASFLFSTLDGTISGWNGKLGTANALSQIVVNNGASAASYTGLALLNTSANSYLLAPNFTSGAVEVYDSTFKAAKLAGSFTDPTLPSGYSPFSVHVLGTQVIVAYALRPAAAPYRPVVGAGNGVVSIFDTNGNFVARAATGGNLNAPWGVAYAPANFGVFSNDLLIGNFGDGKIDVYDPKTFAYQGQLMDSTGKTLQYASLWDLLTGGTAVTGTTAVSAGDTSTVYFSAGLTNEAHGLLAGISNGTTAGAAGTFGFSTAAAGVTVTAGSSTTVGLSMASTNGFTGTVSLTCGGLPVGATCTFSPATMAISTSSPALGSVTIQTAKTTAMLSQTRRVEMAGASLAFVLPLASMIAFRRRKMGSALKLMCLTLLCFAVAGAVSGCNMSPEVATPGTPAGTSPVTITATSGTVAQQTSFNLTVQ